MIPFYATRHLLYWHSATSESRSHICLSVLDGKLLHLLRRGLLFIQSSVFLQNSKELITKKGYKPHILYPPWHATGSLPVVSITFSQNCTNTDLICLKLPFLLKMLKINSSHSTKICNFAPEIQKTSSQEVFFLFSTEFRHSPAHFQSDGGWRRR